MKEIIAFEVSINGQLVSVAGSESASVLAADSTHVKKSGDTILSVGGIVSFRDETDQHVDWIEQRALVNGDEITIRIVNDQTVDATSKAYERRPSKECSFCTKKPKNKHELIGGFGLLICYECVNRFRPAISGADDSDFDLKHEKTENCGVCGKSGIQVEYLIMGDHANICGLYVASCSKIIDGADSQNQSPN